MLHVLRRGVRCFEVATAAPGWRPAEDVVWVDLLKPSREEELAVEAALGVELPTPEEMAHLEPSSRLFQEGGATFLTANILARSGENTPTVEPVTFVLVRGVLVTLRYQDLRAFSVFADRAPQNDVGSGTAAFLGLLDAVTERLAEILDHTEDAVEAASVAIFQRPPSGNFQPLLKDLARAQTVTSMTRQSLVSLARLLSYAGLAPEIAGDPDCQAHLVSLQRDVQSLTEHASFQSTHVSFLLDAALGLINIEQNGIIKFFSVVAVVFLPPTLVASIYGMNFDLMPELHWRYGYPMALVMMVASAVLPILWFKRRGWL
ncbi:magnesium transporter CorA family protein [Phenylobacterium sp.]|jgi:magnesium transporter|uniref:magnesium transporter CorA family protein n=1 Tax=Phenylobacterium sp. TaxID=1871053 RepID=UPI002F95A86C